MSILNAHEIASSGVQKIMNRCKDEIEKLRRKNDSDLDAIATAKLRGRIYELDRILKIGDPEPEVEVPPIPNFSDF